jgi:signal transduction histidine kinase
MAAGSINARRQLVQPYLQLRSWEDLSVLAAAPPETDVPAISGAELLTFRVTGRGDQRVRIGGTVTACFPDGVIFIRDEGAAFAVRFSLPTPVVVGDRVQVIGFPEMERFNPTVLDARLLTREPGPRPEPVELDVESLSAGLHDNDLIAVTARVTDRYQTSDGIVLTLQKDGRAMQARGPAPLNEVLIGSLVRATGICIVESTVGSRYTTRPDTVSLRVRHPDDIVLLQAPSAWTVRRLAGILAVLAGFVLLAGLWITVLRRQVARQTAALRDRIESEAALEERQRIAREFHDTLEQELAGLSLRLDAAATRTMDDKGRGLVAASRNLVARIQAETRNLILDLRSPAESAGDLKAALQELVDAHGGQPGVTVRLRVDDALPKLSAATVHHLRMIAAEGVTNALKHAAANVIDVHVTCEARRLLVTVSDDGRGFDVEGQTRGMSGHFGCVGVRERSRKIGATVRWLSRPGCGAALEASLPLEHRHVDHPGSSRSLAERVI